MDKPEPLAYSPEMNSMSLPVRQLIVNNPVLSRQTHSGFSGTVPTIRPFMQSGLSPIASVGT